MKNRKIVAPSKEGSTQQKTTIPSIATLLQHASHQLEKLSDSPLLDAQLLLADVLDKDRSYLMAWSEIIPTQQQVNLFNRQLEQRRTGIPIAYILGYKEFWSMRFTVTPDVLIPRPETELLVEQVIKACSDRDQPSILELGTGSGAIAIALGKELPDASITAVDLSDSALNVARNNAHNLHIDSLLFFQSNWFSNISDTDKFDIIVSNPPYIENKDPHLSGTIRFEPELALVSGDDGLDAIKIILANSAHYLNNKGRVFLEHGYNQGDRVKKLIMEAGFVDCQTVKDYAANDRITLGLLP